MKDETLGMEPRSLKGYKCRNSVYTKAMGKCQKTYGLALATLIETVVTAVAEGQQVQITQNGVVTTQLPAIVG